MRTMAIDCLTMVNTIGLAIRVIDVDGHRVLKLLKIELGNGYFEYRGDGDELMVPTIRIAVIG